MAGGVVKYELMIEPDKKISSKDRRELESKSTLRIVKARLDQASNGESISNLKTILKNYSNTESAKEAKKLLDELKQKKNQ